MKHAVISLNDTGETVVVPAVVGRRIRLLSGVVTVQETTTARWYSGDTAISGLMTIRGELIYPGTSSLDPMPYLTTNQGESLRFVCPAETPIEGHITYDVID